VPFVTYSVLRLGLVAATIAVLWLVGVRHWLALTGFGVVIGAALAYLLLPRQRDAAVAYLAERSQRRKVAGEDEEVEDALVEGVGTQDEPTPPDTD